MKRKKAFLLTLLCLASLLLVGCSCGSSTTSNQTSNTDTTSKSPTPPSHPKMLWFSTMRQSLIIRKIRNRPSFEQAVCFFAKNFKNFEKSP